MLHFLQELDWHTPVRQVKHRNHWRVYLLAILCTLIAFAVWQMEFPNTLWFYRFWGAIATGGPFGVLVGYTWQLFVASRRAHSSGRYLAWTVIGGVGVLTPVGVLLLGRILLSQELELAKIRTLKATNVAAVSLRVPGQCEVEVAGGESVVSFVEKCHSSSLFYPSHERFTNELQLTVNLVDGKAWTYGVAIPVRHRNDIALSFRAYVGVSYILIPNGAKWFEDVYQSRWRKGVEEVPGTVPAIGRAEEGE